MAKWPYFAHIFKTIFPKENFCISIPIPLQLIPRRENLANRAWGCVTNILWTLQYNLAKKHDNRKHIYGENFKLKLCMCAQSNALGTCLKFKLEILIKSMISAIHKFRENILKSSRNISESTLWWILYASAKWLIRRVIIDSGYGL